MNYINVIICLLLIALSAYYDNFFIIAAYGLGQLVIAITGELEKNRKSN